MGGSAVAELAAGEMRMKMRQQGAAAATEPGQQGAAAATEPEEGSRKDAKLQRGEREEGRPRGRPFAFGKMTGQRIARRWDEGLNDATLKQRKANGRQECREDGK